MTERDEWMSIGDRKQVEDSKMGNRLFQVDFLKAWMIFLVIMDHSFTHAFLRQFHAIFWQRIAIPVFVILMGFNSYISFSKLENPSLKNLYSKRYFRKKFERYLFPYLLLYAIHGIFRIFLQIFSINPDPIQPYENSEYIWLGYTPFYGPGMWFMPVIFGSILILPLFYYFFKKYPFKTLIATFILEITMQILLYIALVKVSYGLPHQFILTNILFLSTGIGLGMWLAKYPNISAIENLFLFLLWFVSTGYVVAFDKSESYRLIPFVGWLTGDYHLLTFPWSMLIVLIVINLFPSDSPLSNFSIIQSISKSTYHILITQMFYFSIIYHFSGLSIRTIFDQNPWHYLWYLPLNVLVTFTVGIFWKRLEDKFLVNQKFPPYRVSYQIMLGLSTFAYICWSLAQLFILFFMLLPIYF